MPAKPFVTDTRSFARKGDAKIFFREMLNRYNPGDRVSAPDAKDLAALIEHHTECAEKLGNGIDYFAVMRNRHDTQSFEIVRLDGTRDDFSYIHCITPKKN